MIIAEKEERGREIGGSKGRGGDYGISLGECREESAYRLVSVTVVREKENDQERRREKARRLPYITPNIGSFVSHCYSFLDSITSRKFNPETWYTCGECRRLSIQTHLSYCHLPLRSLPLPLLSNQCNPPLQPPLQHPSRLIPYLQRIPNPVHHTPRAPYILMLRIQQRIAELLVQSHRLHSLPRVILNLIVPIHPAHVAEYVRHEVVWALLRIRARGPVCKDPSCGGGDESDEFERGGGLCSDRQGYDPFAGGGGVVFETDRDGGVWIWRSRDWILSWGEGMVECGHPDCTLERAGDVRIEDVGGFEDADFGGEEVAGFDWFGW